MKNNTLKLMHLPRHKSFKSMQSRLLSNRSRSTLMSHNDQSDGDDPLQVKQA